MLDKIASVTRACELKREVRVSAEIPCEEGVVVAVRVLNDKSTYNQLELPSGPHGAGEARRRDRRRPRPPARAVRLLRATCRSGWRPATASTCSTWAACWGSATR